jgi:hypothetical protein
LVFQNVPHIWDLTALYDIIEIRGFSPVHIAYRLSIFRHPRYTPERVQQRR